MKIGWQVLCLTTTCNSVRVLLVHIQCSSPYIGLVRNIHAERHSTYWSSMSSKDSWQWVILQDATKILAAEKYWSSTFSLETDKETIGMESAVAQQLKREMF